MIQHIAVLTASGVLMTTETNNQTTHTMPQLIFSDIDGTLIPVRTAILPNHTAQAIRAVTQSGVAFALNTGRQYGFVRPAFAPLLDDIYIICQSGSTIYHRDKLLVHHFLPHKLCLRLEKMFRKLPGTEYIASTHLGYYYIGSAPRHPKMRYMFAVEQMKAVPRIDAIKEPICQLTLYDFDDVRKQKAVVDQMLQGEAHANVGSDLCLDITVTDKGDGVRTLCDLLHISPDQTIGFGDNYNDLPMLRACGKGYLMQTADPQLCRIAPEMMICADVTEALWNMLPPDAHKQASASPLSREI